MQGDHKAEGKDRDLEDMALGQWLRGNVFQWLGRPKPR
jgi:hypothetical protein